MSQSPSRGRGSPSKSRSASQAELSPSPSPKRRKLNVQFRHHQEEFDFGYISPPPRNDCLQQEKDKVVLVNNHDRLNSTNKNKIDKNDQRHNENKNNSQTRNKSSAKHPSHVSNCYKIPVIWKISESNIKVSNLNCNILLESKFTMTPKLASFVFVKIFENLLYMRQQIPSFSQLFCNCFCFCCNKLFHVFLFGVYLSFIIIILVLFLFCSPYCRLLTQFENIKNDLKSNKKNIRKGKFLITQRRIDSLKTNINLCQKYVYNAILNHIQCYFQSQTNEENETKHVDQHFEKNENNKENINANESDNNENEKKEQANTFSQTFSNYLQMEFLILFGKNARNPKEYISVKFYLDLSKKAQNKWKNQSKTQNFSEKASNKLCKLIGKKMIIVPTELYETSIS